MVEKKATQTEVIIRGPTRLPDLDAPDYEEGITYEEKK